MRRMLLGVGIAMLFFFIGLFSRNEAQVTECVIQGPASGWSNPTTTHLQAVNLVDCSDKSPDESADGIELYFFRESGTACPSMGLWFAARISQNDDSGIPEPVLDSTGTQIFGAQPSISSDKMTVYYDNNPNGQFDIYYATRDMPGTNSWTPQGLVTGAVNTTDHDEKAPSIANDGTLLYFCRKPLSGGDHDVYRGWGGTAPSPTSPAWFPLVDIEPNLSSAGVDDLSPDVSSDYSLMVFDRNDGSMNDGVWIASKQKTAHPVFPPRWCPPTKITNSDDPAATDKAPCISGGNSRIHFRSTRGGNGDSNVWLMTKP